MKKILLTLFLLLSTYQAYGQDSIGPCCDTKKNPLEQLAYDFNQVVIHMARNSWEGAISVKEVEWPFAAFLLRYSLQDNPKDLSFTNGSRASELIRNTSEYQKSLSIIKDQLKKIDKQETTEGSLPLQFNSGDLFVALHNTTLSYTAKKVGKEWQLKITVSDLYDFAYLTPDEVGDIKLRTINNMAFDDQQRGIINNYRIFFNIEETIK